MTRVAGTIALAHHNSVAHELAFFVIVEKRFPAVLCTRPVFSGRDAFELWYKAEKRI